MLFTFPSRYCCAIGRQMCLALDRGRPGFIRNFTCSALLGCLLKSLMYVTYGAFTLCGTFSQHVSIIHKVCNSLKALQSFHRRSRYPVYTTPAGLTYKRFTLCPFRSPLLGVSLTISFPRVTEMFHFSRLPLHSEFMDCSMRVAPFRDPRIYRCLLFPAAFRSSLRLSSASGAKAFPACPLYLNLINPLLTLFIPILALVSRILLEESFWFRPFSGGRLSWFGDVER